MGLTLLMTARMLVGFARYDLRRLKDALGESSSGRLPLVAQRGTEGGCAGSQVGFLHSHDTVVSLLDLSYVSRVVCGSARTIASGIGACVAPAVLSVVLCQCACAYLCMRLATGLGLCRALGA